MVFYLSCTWDQNVNRKIDMLQVLSSVGLVCPTASILLFVDLQMKKANFDSMKKICKFYDFWYIEDTYKINSGIKGYGQKKTFDFEYEFIDYKFCKTSLCYIIVMASRSGDASQLYTLINSFIHDCCVWYLKIKKIPYWNLIGKFTCHSIYTHILNNF